MLSEQAVLKHWVADGRTGGLLTDGDRRDVVARIRRDYQARGVPWPGVVFWVPSPSELEQCRLRRRPPPNRSNRSNRLIWKARSTPLNRLLGPPVRTFERLARLTSRPLRGIPRDEVIEEVGPGPRADPVSGWIAARDRVLICGPPRVVRTEQLGAGGHYRPHNESGPAVEWPDGSFGYYLHGVAIPADLFQNPSVEAIHREVNSEVRRLAIERMGWLRYIQEADLELVAVTPDPGNAGHQLQLYDLPKGRFEPARLLVMVNGSPDRSGRERQYVELVPDWIDDPVQAAAWQYGCPADVYRQVGRRT